MNFKPYADYILCTPIAEKEVTAGGIHIPSTAQKRSQEALVDAVGSGRRLSAKVVLPMEVKVGDRILINQYGGTEISVEGVTYTMLREEEVLGVLINADAG